MLGDRSTFPNLAYDVYFNHAAMTPVSQPVREAMVATMASYEQIGADAWFPAREARESLRHNLATLCGSSAESIALMPNTSYGIAAIASSLELQRGDRILLFTGEFPSNVSPWQAVARRAGVDLVFANPDQLWTDDGIAALTAELSLGLRLVAISAVQFQTGLRMPLERIGELCRAVGTRFFVDGIQALGGLPVDVAACHIDYLAAGGHKWLMGPEGTGMLYVAPDRACELDPLLIGWLSHEDGTRFLVDGAGHLRTDLPLRERADVFEIGCMNSVGFAGLGAAVERLVAAGPVQIHSHVQSILDPLENGLKARDFDSVRSSNPAARSNILSVRPPEDLDLAELQQALLRHGLSVATPDGFLRFSPHAPNSIDEVESALDRVDRAVDELRRNRA
ncbi:MAG: aminotransferase class V-fold PLP-dependent enzyme [Planctomycetota bacterium]